MSCSVPLVKMSLPNLRCSESFSCLVEMLTVSSAVVLPARGTVP